MAGAASVQGTIAPGGAVALSVAGTISNGSSLRYAIDGNFGPIVDLLPVNASTRTAILAAIALDQAGIGGFVFGNGDGYASPTEVASFETLLEDARQFLPASTFNGSSLLAVTLDGAPPSTSGLDSVSLLNATGPDNSSAPIQVVVALSFGFATTGSSHTLAVGTNVTGAAFGLSLFVPSISVGLTFPAGTTITGTAGFASVAIASDPWGWSSPTVAGSVDPATATSASVSYGPAFPSGDALLITIPILAAVGVGLSFLYLRRRRRRRDSSSS